MSTTENSITVGSWKWFYRQAQPSNESDKLPVILLHGLPAHSFIWREMMPDLAAAGFCAIAPDWIGSGFSSKPDKRDFSYTPQAYIDALGDFLTALNISKFHLIVQGFLASVGLQYALRHPEQIERLVILNTPLSTKAKLPFKMQQWGWLFAGDMLTQDPLLVDRSLENGSGFVIADQNLAMFRKPFRQSSDVGRALLTTVKKLNLASSMTELETGFSQWQQPTLIVWGMADPWLAAEDAENLARNLTNGELVKLPEAKHYPQEHWYEEINQAILPFLRRQLQVETSN